MCRWWRHRDKVDIARRKNSILLNSGEGSWTSYDQGNIMIKAREYMHKYKRFTEALIMQDEHTNIVILQSELNYISSLKATLIAMANTLELHVEHQKEACAIVHDVNLLSEIFAYNLKRCMGAGILLVEDDAQPVDVR